MAIIPNQGFRKDLNFGEGINDTNALNNLGGAGIANDLRIIQNNLRNKDVLTWTAAPPKLLSALVSLIPSPKLRSFLNP